MGRLLFALFLLLPLIEIAGFVLIGGAIGLWPTLAGVLVTAIAGALVLRWKGLSLLGEMRATMGRGQLPARSLADAMLLGVAGLLLIIPGYFTDLVGLLLLLPPLRALIYGILRSRIRVVEASVSTTSYPSQRLEEGTIELDDDEWRKR